MVSDHFDTRVIGLEPIWQRDGNDEREIGHATTPTLMVARRGGRVGETKEHPMVELTPTADTRAMLAILKAMLARMDTEERERIWGAALIHAQDAATSEAGRAAVRAAIDRVFEG